MNDILNISKIVIPKNSTGETFLTNKTNLNCYSYVSGYGAGNDSNLRVVQCRYPWDKCLIANSTFNDVKKSWLGCVADYCVFNNITYDPKKYEVDGCHINYTGINGNSYTSTFCLCSRNLCNTSSDNHLSLISKLYIFIGLFIILIQQSY
uniref:Protein sleepless n=1 Tax=Strongyloides stercoralis TaxID=6248 RepID=A0A0K0ENR6_STRER